MRVLGYPYSQLFFIFLCLYVGKPGLRLRREPKKKCDPYGARPGSTLSEAVRRS